MYIIDVMRTLKIKTYLLNKIYKWNLFEILLF